MEPGTIILYSLAAVLVYIGHRVVKEQEARAKARKEAKEAKNEE